MRDKLKADLTRDEGIRLKPYTCPAGKLTIGVGRNLDDVGITSVEADAMLNGDIDRVCRELDKNVAWWRSRPEHVQRGLANMAFQMGMAGLLGFKRMLAALQAGDYETAQKEAGDSAWYKQTPARAERVISLFTEKEKPNGK